MILSLAILLLAGQVESDCVRVPRAGGCVRANGRSGAGFAFFEAFPASGAGTAGVCSTTAPTGARGELLTFTRGSNGTCTKTATGGLATTGIANGDLVVLSSNVARVEYDSQGVLGLLVEESRTNSNVRSEEINNAAYADQFTGAAAPTLNSANAGTAPDNAVTAEDYTFPATTAGQQSGRLGGVVAGCAGVACAHSIFVRGVSGSGTLDLCAWDTTTPTCAPCAFVDTSWSRCTYATTRSGNVALFIGNNTLYNGGTVRSSNRVYVWGAQLEVGAYATSYIPTVAAAVTRSAENADFPLALSPASGVSVAATLNVVSTSAMLAGSGLWLPSPSGGSLGAAFTSPYVWHYAGSTGGNLSIDATGSASAGAATAVSGATSGRYYSTFSAAWTVCRDASCATSGALSWSGPTWTRLKLNATPGITPSAHLWSRICVDPDPSRCR